ncbi:Glycogen synthase kinase-3 beta [Globodera pallida]|nr:Glycogen synthase kinase-3 beta [Globodera pallida]
MSTKRPQSGIVSVQSQGSGFTRDINIQYSEADAASIGSFGLVYLAKLMHNNESVAIKKVLQDNRFELMYFFRSDGVKRGEVYLNLVLEFVPSTVYRVAEKYAKKNRYIPILYTKVYMYQLFRALGYIHCLGIFHRDLKPQNLLLCPQTSVLKLCDFGTAKTLVRGQPNSPNVCTRWYRAPEMLLGATDYTTKIGI